MKNILLKLKKKIKEDIKDIKNYQLFHDDLPKNLDIIKVFSWIRISSTFIKKEYVQLQCFRDTGYPVFGKINFITYYEKSDVVYFF